METAFSTSTEEVLVRLLVQFAVILVTARLSGALFGRLGQSTSIGEILGGVMLGPSLLGWVAPGVFAALFPSEGPSLVPYFSHLGLVLALFLIGMEFDFRAVLPHLRGVFGISLATLVAPLLAGAVVSPWLWALVPGDKGYLPYALFVGMCLGITAIPIMGRLLMEQGLTRTRAGVLAITAGAGKDLFTWFLLAVVSGVAAPPLDPWRVVGMVGASFALGAVALTAGRWLVARAAAFTAFDGEHVPPALFTTLIVLLLLMAAATSEIGIFAVFGAFLTGVTVSTTDRRLALAMSERIHDLTVYLFLPIFFTYTGLRADLSQLEGALWLAMVGTTVVGTLACGGVAAGVARLSGLTREESVSIGALMNTPGLMVLILLNIGLDLGVIPVALFSVLVGNAMLRNLLVTPALRWAKARGLAEPEAPRLAA